MGQEAPPSDFGGQVHAVLMRRRYSGYPVFRKHTSHPIFQQGNRIFLVARAWAVRYDGDTVILMPENSHAPVA